MGKTFRFDKEAFVDEMEFFEDFDTNSLQWKHQVNEKISQLEIEKNMRRQEKYNWEE